MIENGITEQALTAQPLERLIAEALRYGTWLASAAIAIGLIGPALTGPAAHGAASMPWLALVKVGIALFISLPVLRVVLMLAAFLRGRDYRMSAVAALVLIIIAVGAGMT